MTVASPLRGLWKLTWLEIKIFVREPMGFISSIAIPVMIFVVLGRTLGQRLGEATSQSGSLLRVSLPVFVAVFIAINTVLSLVAIISIYREGGILKRLRATPLRPVTILVTHVLVKLLLTAVTVVLMILAGRRYYPAGASVPVVAFTLALLLSTWSILSIGFTSPAWSGLRGSPHHSAVSSSTPCCHSQGFSRLTSRPQSRWHHGSCRSPMPCRCSPGSGKATPGPPTSATSRHWS